MIQMTGTQKERGAKGDMPKKTARGGKKEEIEGGEKRKGWAKTAKINRAKDCFRKRGGRFQ